MTNQYSQSKENIMSAYQTIKEIVIEESDKPCRFSVVNHRDGLVIADDVALSDAYRAYKKACDHIMFLHGHSVEANCN